MLKELHIENYLLINKLDIDFSNKLNIITGETGAGKSILLGAISLLLGGKAEGNIAKDKTKKVVLEAVFDVSKLIGSFEAIFAEEDIEIDSELIIRRVVAVSGKSKFYVNEEPVTQGFIRSISEKLMDIHSQHQTLLLGNSEFQIGALDSIADNHALLKDYSEEFDGLRKKEQVLSGLVKQADEAAKNQEYVQFQFTQLDDAKLSVDEFGELEQRFQFLSNAQLISENLYEAVNLISQQDNSILSNIHNIRNSFSKIIEFIPDGADFAERLESVAIELKDIDGGCQAVLDGISGDPTELEFVSSRLDLINSLQMKHRVSSVGELVEIREGLKAQLELIDNYDENIKMAKDAVAKSLERTTQIANNLSQKRAKSTTKLEKFVVDILNNLGMVNSVLKVSMTACKQLNKYGLDDVEFLFSANKGVECEAISKVASGGEMSRLMLALKALISSTQDMPTIIFDEIDTGVSGKVADKMGEIIMQMSKNRQIINITHLPQVAAKGETHLFVYKQDTELETVTNIRKLSYEERVGEIASMLSGEKTTQSAIAQAQELLDSGTKL